MTKEEYYKLVLAENQRHDEALASIESKYAFDNNPVKVGDIVSDHYQTIKVEKIKCWKDYKRMPECVYYGQLYTAKGVPCKKERFGDVYQSNLKKINGKLI